MLFWKKVILLCSSLLWASLLPGSCFLLCRNSLKVKALDCAAESKLLFCWCDENPRDVLVREGVGGIAGQQSIPALPAPVCMAWKGWDPETHPCLPLTRGVTQLWQLHLGQLRDGEGLLVLLPLVPLWPPIVLCMEVKHIPVINMIKINLELSKLYLEWCELSYKCNPWVQLGFGAFWSVTEVLLFQTSFSLTLLS